MTIHPLKKRDRLKRQLHMQQVFAEGVVVKAFPLRVQYLYQAKPEDANPGLRMGVGVSKRNFKKAVDRNRIKRLLREAYRTQCLLLRDGVHQLGGNLAIFFMFVGKEMPDYTLILKQTQVALAKIQDQISGKS